MAETWSHTLERWVGAGLVEAAAAERIRAFEASRDEPQRLRWPVRVAIAFGGVLLGAGVLLFVEANWDELSPRTRFAAVLALVGAFHVVGAAVAARLPVLASVLHAVGTASLGAGIFLCGQIFHLQEHWPGGFMLWALGAGFGLALLRSWPQVAFAAVLTPVWLTGEWMVATEGTDSECVAAAGLSLLAITYFTAPTRDQEDAIRRALLWIGGAAALPLVLATIALSSQTSMPRPAWLGVGWAVALLLPLAPAVALRGRDAWIHALAAVWVVALVWIASRAPLGESVATYLWCGVGAIGMVAWGLRDERRERINLGVAAFALTIVAFYFASVFDKLGRAASLVGLGVLFFVLGAALDRVRKRLIARVEGARE